MTHHTTPAQAEGLYDPRFEHDACGVAMVARLDDEQTHEVVRRALEALDNLEHRGAEGADVRTGDGAGILVQLPDAFLRGVAGVELPPPGQYGVGMCFLPHDRAVRAKLEDMIERNVRVEGQRVLGWRDVPVDEAHVGSTANASRPYVKQLFVGAGGDHDPARPDGFDQDAFERKLYVIRRIVELAAGPSFYAAVLLLAHAGLQGDADLPPAAGLLPRPPGRALRQRPGPGPLALLDEHLPELGPRPPVPRHRAQRRDQHAHGQRQLDARPRVAARLRALRARPPEDAPGRAPGRVGLGHLRQRPRAAHARGALAAPRGDDDDPGGLRGPRRPLRRAQGLLRLPLVPHGAVGRAGRRRLHDGRVVGATLDRNGLRPGRWVETKDGHVILGSETGMLDVAPAEVLRKGRLAPGKLFLVDLDRGRIVEDGEVKREVATHRPYAEWHRANVVHFNDLEPRPGAAPHRAAAPRAPARVRLHAGGPARPAGPDGGPRARSPSAPWATTRRSRCSRTAGPRSSATSSSSSRRSRTRPSTRSASSS